MKKGLFEEFKTFVKKRTSTEDVKLPDVIDSTDTLIKKFKPQEIANSLSSILVSKLSISILYKLICM